MIRRGKHGKGRVKAGLPPGALVHVGERKVDKARITVVEYGPDHVDERAVATAAAGLESARKAPVTWIHIDGLHEVDIIEQLGKQFSLHPLLVEDLLNTEQRPKLEDYEGSLFVVLKMLTWNKDREAIEEEQLSLILGQNFVISLQEHPSDIFNPVRERLRNTGSRARRSGPDYLAYMLLDAVVDQYLVVLESFGQGLEALDRDLLENVDALKLTAMQHMKREILRLRRAIAPVRDVIATLQRADSSLIAKHTRYYLRDVHDHSARAAEWIESYRDMLTGMLDIYLSLTSQRLNEVMKILTMIASVFIPLTLIAGIYGMNFAYMPELDLWWAYPAVLGVMLLLALLSVLYFKRKGWF